MTNEKSTEDSEKTEPPPDFAAFLTTLNRGRSNRDLSAKLAELVEAIEETGKAGSLTYTIKIKPQKAGGMVILTDEVRASVPRGERPEAVAFIGRNFALLRNPVDQPSLYDEITQETTK